MSVYIKGMDMPKNCLDCDFSKVQTYDDTIRCCVPSEESFGENVTDYVTVRAQFCPLVEVKTGKWIDIGEFIGIGGKLHEVWKCECCGFISYDDSNFCPNCGAKMEDE